MSDTTKPLPPLVEVFRKIAEPLEAKERSARARKYTHEQLGSEAYVLEAWEQDAALYGNDAACFRRAEDIAAPYDAELARLRKQNDQLGNQLAEAASSAIALRELLREALPFLIDKAGDPGAHADLMRRIQEVAQ